MEKLTFKLPGPDEPGFLLRRRRAFQCELALKNGLITTADIDTTVAFLAEFVAEPTDPAEVRGLLLRLSENEFFQVFDQLKGRGASAEPPLASNDNSTNG